MPGLSRVGIVAIGRNEGERLKACLRSVVGAGPVAYVDSGSTDGSQEFAAGLGVEVVALAVPPAFTAARARNAGAAALLTRAPELEYLQMVDGDCEVREGWIAAAVAALEAEPDLALVFGRRRERHPDRSIYNALADDEWNVPVGEAQACGGDVMLRVSSFRQVGGYPETMIAGEEPDMSMRLRKAGWRLRRIDAEMTLHDAGMTRFGQWWNRTRRAGHAFAELAHRHPEVRSPDWKAICRRIILWGGVLPAIGLAGLVGGLWWRPLLLVPVGWLLLVRLNIMRLAARRRREGLPRQIAHASAVLLMVGKLPEFLGLLRFHRNRLLGRGATLIEYKGPEPA